MKQRRIFVDFDGTIVDVLPRYYELLQAYIGRPCQLNFESYKYLKRLGIKDHDIVSRLCDGHCIELSSYLKFKRSNLEEIEWLRKDTIIGFPKDSYDKLKRLGYSVVLLTQRRSEQNLTEQIRLLNLDDCFDDLIVVRPLVDQNAKLIYLENKTTSDDVIVGDSMVETECAEKLGLRGFFVRSGLWDQSFAGSVVKVFDDYDSVIDFLVYEQHCKVRSNDNGV